MIVEVNNRSIGIFNVDGKYFGLANKCPHKGAEMCKGHVVGHLSSDGPGDFEYDTSRKYVMCPWHGWEFDVVTGQSYFCLLYTSDAADEEDSVDLGGRRIIKKKKKKK